MATIEERIQNGEFPTILAIRKKYGIHATYTEEHKMSTPILIQINDIPRDCGLSEDDWIAIARYQREEQDERSDLLEGAV